MIRKNMHNMQSKKTTHKKKYTIALLYHNLTKDEEESYPDKEHVIVDKDTNNTVAFLKELLVRHGYRITTVQISRNSMENLKSMKAHFVFNLVDSRSMEVRIARILDRLHIPHSGSSVKAIQSSNNKIKTKRILEKMFLPIPQYQVIRLTDRLRRSLLPAKFPVIVKPAFDHCSIGITSQSVAQNYNQFKQTVTNLRKKYHQTLLVEEFIPGEELQITVYENGGKTVALPPAQITWKGNIKNKWNIYGFDEKWDKTSPLWDSCQFIAPPKKISDSIIMDMKKQSIRAFYAMQFKDYARFDLRFNNKTKQWYFLEGNANAGISPGAGDAMTASILAAKMTMDDFILQIVKNSLH